MFGLKERRAETRTEERVNAKARTIGMILLMIALPVLIVFLTFRLQFRQLVDTDVMDMAQVARNLANSRGFVTSAVRPIALTIHKDAQTMPDMIHAPLYPMAMAVTLATNASDNRVFVTAALFFLLTIPVLYALTKAMFNQKAAYLTLFAYVTSTLMLGVLSTASAGPMLAFLFTSLCLAMFRFAQYAAPSEGNVPDRKRATRFAALVGFLAALCYLTDYLLLFAFLPVAAFVFLMGGPLRKQALGAFLIAFLVAAGPWWIRNMMVGVNPFFGLRTLEIGMVTSTYPGVSLYRSTTPHTTLGLLQELKLEVLRKMGLGMVNAYQQLSSLGTPYLMAFFIVGLFYSFRRTGVNAVRGFIIASFLCVMLFGSMFLLQTNTLAAFVPVLLGFAAAYFVRLVTDARFPTLVGRAIMTLAVIVFAVPMITRFSLVRAPQVPHQIESIVAAKVAPGVPVLTDRVSEMAWYGSRTSIWLPVTEKDIQNLDAIQKQGAVYLSRFIPSYGGTEFDVWKGFYGNAARGLNEGQFMKVSGKTLSGLALYRDMTEEETLPFRQNGALLFMRPEGVRSSAN